MSTFFHPGTKVSGVIVEVYIVRTTTPDRDGTTHIDRYHQEEKWANRQARGRSDCHVIKTLGLSIPNMGVVLELASGEGQAIEFEPTPSVEELRKLGLNKLDPEEREALEVR